MQFETLKTKIDGVPLTGCSAVTAALKLYLNRLCRPCGNLSSLPIIMTTKEDDVSPKKLRDVVDAALGDIRTHVKALQDAGDLEGAEDTVQLAREMLQDACHDLDTLWDVVHEVRLAAEDADELRRLQSAPVFVPTEKNPRLPGTLPVEVRVTWHVGNEEPYVDDVKVLTAVPPEIHRAIDNYIKYGNALLLFRKKRGCEHDEYVRHTWDEIVAVRMDKVPK